MTGTIRKAQVAGRFYPSDPDEINELIGLLAEKEKLKINYSLSEKQISGAVLPHAGHIYSGYQTVHFFEILKRSQQFFDTWIIIHPLHHGGLIDFVAEGSDYWNTPLGNVRIDQEFIQNMGVPVSRDAHKFEHSAEVILPFIQKYYDYDFSLVSVGMSKQNPNSSLKLSEAILKAQKLSKKKICIIASSDFSHYVSPEAGKAMDQKVVDCILCNDIQGIYREVSENDLSVCGYGPIMVVCYTLNKLYKDIHPVILARGNSGEVYPSQSVVDYISILFYH